ncbi:hypothetical protein C7974DRAFT_447540 [Boeremia exigua]|uniref:uncharacterized protein n=1 Tax=Boeremia exigua TaxID=749465 RepID=UPI001E8E7D60|nr:uncharacterized protein C7974DRAFT_447540 [Boeremia exigua]KAH6642777.1 hypothetical protein C7974DRAFT_447540 [Boeremia exigua]
MPDKTPQTYTSIKTHLLATTSLALPPSKPLSPSLTPQIAALSLHPALESALHILNHDLPSAHFLVRHMQAPPAVEGMLLHGILHRCEGDMGNARAWFGDVGDICGGWVPKKRGEGERLEEGVREKCAGPGEGGLLEWVYGEGEGGMELIDGVEAWRKGGRKGGEEGELVERIRAELGRVLEWCERKFGTQAWVDAREAWVKNSEEVQKMSNDMVSGGKGFREF